MHHLSSLSRVVIPEVLLIAFLLGIIVVIASAVALLASHAYASCCSHLRKAAIQRFNDRLVLDRLRSESLALTHQLELQAKGLVHVQEVVLDVPAHRRSRS